MNKILVILLIFISATSIVSGVFMMIYPVGTILNLSVSLLKGTAFKDFQIPGLILSVVVGGINLLALFFIMQKHPYRYNWAIAGAVVLSGWIVDQLILIQTLHWLHFIYFGIGIFNILISYQLKGKWAL